MQQTLNLRVLTETLLGLGLLLLAWYKLIYRLDELMEVRLYDESYYLWAGQHFFNEDIHPEFSPLYAFWYWLLSHFEADGLRLYHLNYKVLSLCMPLSAYLFLRAAGVRAFLGAMLAIFLLASGMNLPVWPKMANLITTIVLLSMAILLVFEVKKQAVWLFTGMLLSTVFMYMRPEFLLAAIVFFAWFLWHIFSAGSKRDVVWFIAALVPLALAVHSFGFPVGSGPRGMIAFGQHFMHNMWLRAGAADDEAMNVIWVNWREYIQPYFGEASGVVQAFIHNPAVFLQHIGYNMYALLFKGLYVILETNYPTRIFHFSPSILFLMSLVLLGIHIKGKATIGELFLMAPDFSAKIRWMSVLCVPALAAALIFQPRAHYIMVITVPFLFCVGLMYENYLRLMYPGKDATNKYWALTLVVLYLSPGTERFYNFRAAYKAEPLADSVGVILIDKKENTEIIQRLNKVALPDTIRLIDASTGYSYYLKRPFTHFGTIAFEFDYAAFEHIDTLIHRNNVNMIIVGETLRYDHTFSSNKGWNDLVNNPSQKGFTKHKLGASAYVLLRR